MNQTVRIPNTCYFFVSLKNERPQYFTVKKMDGVFKIYLTNFTGTISEEVKKVLTVEGTHSIEFNKNSFILKDCTGKIIYKADNLPEFEMIYMDNDLRDILRSREQLICDEDACRMLNIPYEPIKESSENQKEQSSKGFARVRRPQHNDKI